MTWLCILSEERRLSYTSEESFVQTVGFDQGYNELSLVSLCVLHGLLNRLGPALRLPPITLSVPLSGSWGL